MLKLTLCEKYVILSLTKEGKINYLKGLQNGIYVSALMDLVHNKLINDEDGVKCTGDCPENLELVKVMFDFIQENNFKKLKSVLQSFTSPFKRSVRKDLTEDIMKSIEKKGIDASQREVIKKQLIEDLLQIRQCPKDIESLILGKLVVAFKICKKDLSKEEYKQLKVATKYEELYDEEIKAMLKVIDSLAVAGALVGAGAI